MKETFTVSEKDMEELAHKVLHLLYTKETSKAKVLLLDGDLGSGKTTFTKELASLIGIPKEKVNSPTFILKKEYDAEHPLFKKLIHVDAYRFNTPQEGRVLRIEDDLGESDTIVAIEWPTKMKYLKADLDMSFTIIDDDTREVTLAYDEVHDTKKYEEKYS